MNIFVLAKRMGNLLHDATDISRQLADAVDRQDDVSAEMILAMRRQPIDRLLVTDQALREQIGEIDDAEEKDRIRALLNGTATVAQNATEQALSEQVAANTRLHQKLLELDRVISYKMGRDKSIYQ
ncbi:MAG: hypothetical protein IJ955_04305 [Oscillospiraceae bacterium]|nr:hypothetical protein [Oscillospiraceae bacterium]